MIYITRHGQTDWNLLKKVQGRKDEPLNETGINQAIKTSKTLKDEKIDLIISSPLLRAKQTVNEINKNRNIPVIYDERIIERDFGEFEGFNKEKFDFHSFWNYYKDEKYEKAENIKDFFKRVYDFLDDIKTKYKDKNVLLVAHGGISIPVECYFKNYIPKGSLIDAGLVLNNCEVRKYDKKIRKAVRTLLIKDNIIVAIKNNCDKNKDYYDLPGGKIEFGETPEEASIREFKEETGIDIINQYYKGNLIVEYPNMIFDFDVYIVTDFKGEPNNFEENDSMWIDINDLLNKDKKIPSIEMLKYLNEDKINLKIYTDENHNIKEINNG